MAERARCSLCGRQVRTITHHHLVPRTRHRNQRTRRRFSRDTLRRKIQLCKPCHDTIHATLTEKELADEYHTLEALAAHPKIAAFVDWIRNRRDVGRLKVKRSRREGKTERHERVRRARRKRGR
jgi:hypothetical protein